MRRATVDYNRGPAMLHLMSATDDVTLPRGLARAALDYSPVDVSAHRWPSLRETVGPGRHGPNCGGLGYHVRL